jgi:preprotein translocase SecF subunit
MNLENNENKVNSMDDANNLKDDDTVIVVDDKKIDENNNASSVVNNASVNESNENNKTSKPKKSHFSLEDKIRNIKFDFVKNFKWFLFVSLAIILTGIIVVCFAGFNLGIDFTGGTILNIKFGNEISTTESYNQKLDEVKDVLNNYGLTVSYNQQQGSGSESVMTIRYQDKKGLTESQMEDLSSQVKKDLQEKYNPEGVVGGVTISDASRISPSASVSLILTAVLSVLVACDLILIYVAIRFELLSGLCSILGLFHDVAIMCALVAIFRIQINSEFIAAIITIVGYSINNSIIIFDRIRENKKNDKYATMPVDELANRSISETLLRTINTSLTTLLTIVLIGIIGVPSIKEFIIPIIFGLVAGLYSSIFLVVPNWAKITIARQNIKNKKNKKITTDEVGLKQN